MRLPVFEALSPALRWSLVAVAVAVAVAAVRAMARHDRVMRAAGGGGIVAFELARTAERAARTKRAWGAAGCAAARRSLRTDFVFVAAYVLVPLVVTGAAAEVLRERGQPVWAGTAALSGWLFAVAGLLDVVENVLLLRVLATDPPPGAAARGAALAATGKFALLLAGLVVGPTTAFAALGG